MTSYLGHNPGMPKDVYHHGDLRAALLAATAEQIATNGVDSVSLRDLARRVGVSHAAPAHHFGDRRGLLTELAVEGFDLLAAELEAASADLREAALAYVRFALRHPGHFSVMFRRDLLKVDDSRLVESRNRSGSVLEAGIAGTLPEELTPQRRRDAQLAAWSLVHGFASLWLEGALEASELAGDTPPEELARRMVRTVLFE